MPGDESFKKIPLFQVDAFTAIPFAGNPAAVCLLDEFPQPGTMRKIAMEMNLSETAFVVPAGNCPANSTERFQIRWFTPTVEVPLCGHATLAASHVLFHEIGTPRKQIFFESASGPLSAKLADDGITLDFPMDMPQPAQPPKEVLSAMGIEGAVDVQIALQALMLLVRVGDEETVRRLSPDFSAMLRADRGIEKYEGVIVTSLSTDHDFVSRYFGPWEGLNEDPVTGSAHTVLAPYWSRIMGKDAFRAFQASARGGELALRMTGNRVEITGRACVVFKGDLMI
ncbi:MAG: PhzF family phenazine biosynthesis protein [Thermovirgaceae bacterium]|nr:PhzF family phenazine biosynthesis protein [Thermovirgaceae bacterium]